MHKSFFTVPKLSKIVVLSLQYTIINLSVFRIGLHVRAVQYNSSTQTLQAAPLINRLSYQIPLDGYD